MHHKSTAKLGTDGVPSKHPLMLTLHILVQNWGRPFPVAMQMLPWESVLPRLLRSLKPKLAVPARMQIFCNCTANASRCRMLPAGIR